MCLESLDGDRQGVGLYFVCLCVCVIVCLESFGGKGEVVGWYLIYRGKRDLLLK